MSRIKQVFTKNPAFVGYFTAGDGGIEYSVKAAQALIKGGVDILEIGLPFSDPIADGPTIQAAMLRSLEAKITSQHVLELGREIRHQFDVPLVLFSYYNPLLQAGKSYLHQLKEVGFDGILIVDLPLEEAVEQLRLQQDAGLDSIWIATPTTPKERLQEVVSISQGFIYYACQKGTTGVRAGLPDDLAVNLKRIKELTNTPVVAGFGIGHRTSAKAVLEHADGFVVGSAFVKAMGLKANPVELEQIARDIDPRTLEITEKTEQTTLKNNRKGSINKLLCLY